MKNAIKDGGLFEELKNSIQKDANFTKVDDILILELSTYVEVFEDARNQIKKAGSAIQVFKNGTSNVSGAFTAMDKASKHIRDIAFKMGIYDQIKKKLHNYGKVTKDNSAKFS
jgi:phage terminase small subunit